MQSCDHQCSNWCALLSPPRRNFDESHVVETNKRRLTFLRRSIFLLFERGGPKLLAALAESLIKKLDAVRDYGMTVYDCGVAGMGVSAAFERAPCATAATSERPYLGSQQRRHPRRKKQETVKRYLGSGCSGLGAGTSYRAQVFQDAYLRILLHKCACVCVCVAVWSFMGFDEFLGVKTHEPTS